MRRPSVEEVEARAAGEPLAAAVNARQDTGRGLVTLEHSFPHLHRHLNRPEVRNAIDGCVATTLARFARSSTRTAGVQRKKASGRWLRPLNEPGARGVEFMTTAVLVPPRVRPIGAAFAAP